MEYIITGVIFGLCLFILPLWAYRRGLQDGLALNKGANTLEPIKGPLAVIQERRKERETKKQNDFETQGWANILAYDGTPQKGGDD
jgi:hypothetical protein